MTTADEDSGGGIDMTSHQRLNAAPGNVLAYLFALCFKVL
jgi:hypothetical protein